MHRLSLVLLMSTSLVVGAASPVYLWPGDAPGETKALDPERDMTKPTDNLVGGKPVIRLGNVSKPSLTVYRPAKEKDTGTTVVVLPGGGYHILAMDLEGTEVCEWLNSIGVTGVLVKYRVPKRDGMEKHGPPLQDAQRAMALVRNRATEWNLNPNRIGVFGASAGGHLAAALAASTNRTYPKVDEADEQSSRPDFSILLHPAYLTLKDQGDKIAPDTAVSSNSPPTFIAMTQDDPVRVETALFYFLALKQAKVPSELHIYPTGGHGYGMRRTEHYVTTWPDRAADWMKSRGLLKR